MFGLGVGELLLIFGILILFFGAKRLPGIASAMGGSINSFKKSLQEGADANGESPKQLDGDNTQE